MSPNLREALYIAAASLLLAFSAVCLLASCGGCDPNGPPCATGCDQITCEQCIADHCQEPKPGSLEAPCADQLAVIDACEGGSK